MTQQAAHRVDVAPHHVERADEVLTSEALAFLSELHHRFEKPRRSLLEARRRRQAALDAGWRPDFLEETRPVRRDDWQVPPAPADLRDRRVEITGPVDRKMVINALNSGAKVFMADFEDAHTPSWQNNLEGQVNLVDAVAGTISLTTPQGKEYRLQGKPATLVVRPRGWHLDERHVTIGGQPLAGGLFDVGLYLFHNTRRLLAKGTGPYFYLPKLENHEEARLWDEVFGFAEERLGLRRGTIRATVLIETVLAAFEMDEILHALKDHALGLNAGRWDYIFSIIKKFRNDPAFVLPDRAQVTMAVSFMRNYTQLLVSTCHRRGAHAMGGMAAFIPNRRDPEVTQRALAQVRQDKQREAGDGFDGTWVAHPGLIPVAQEVFDRVLGDQPHQLGKARQDVNVAAKDLLDIRIPQGRVTTRGLEDNVDVGLQYIASWLAGHGAAAIHNLMEDTATAEISRSQVWQWVRHGVKLEDGRAVTAQLVRQTTEAALGRLRQAATDPSGGMTGRLEEARTLFEEVALGADFVEFLTLPAYQRID